ncbi:MAG: hypothetical protein GX957_07570 [Clostridiaceae bacterium]|jgi:cell division initiation protein|nr:hypothetical protein [Clostridiaceae bacterium]
MRKMFKTKMFGYNKHQVEQYLKDMRKDYEEELSKKRMRMMELTEENRGMKSLIRELEDRLSEFSEKEAYISKALVRAEQKAQAVIEEGHQKTAQEMYQLELEKNKWKARSREVRRQLLEFERMVCTLLENFYSEINYLTSKELSEQLFLNEEEELKEEQKETDIFSVS